MPRTQHHIDNEQDAMDWMDRLKARIRGFNSDESGQSIVYLVLIMFLLACFTFMVINSGALLHDKMQVQSASDSAVLSGSTWMVRAMNLNSMMNILMAMCMAELIFMKAVYWTALTALILSPIIEAFWLAVCLTTGTCNPAVEVVFDTFELFPILFDSDENEDFMWDCMETLTDVEAGVHASLPVVAELESVRMAMMNGAGFGIMYPPTIPEEEGELQDLCECVYSGMPGGYSEVMYSAFGSLTTALGEIGGFQYAGDMRNMAYDLVSGFLGIDGPLWGELQIPYHIFWADTAPYHFTNVMFIMAVWARYAVMCGGSFPPNSLSFEVDAAWWCFFCDDNEITIPNPAYYLGAAFAFLESGNPNVKPMMLVDDWEEQRNYYGFAYKTPEDIQAHFIPDVFQNTYGDSVGMITVAQAQIYNPHVEGGMFSPHWRTHLAPVQLSSGTAEAAGGYVGGAPASGEGDPGAVGGLLSTINSLTGDGIDGLMAH
jgi:hypothetical protein